MGQCVSKPDGIEEVDSSAKNTAGTDSERSEGPAATPSLNREVSQEAARTMSVESVLLQVGSQNSNGTPTPSVQPQPETNSTNISTGTQDNLWSALGNVSSRYPEVWTTLKRLCDHVSSTTGIDVVSLTVVSSSKMYSQSVSNSNGSKQTELDLVETSTLPSIQQVVSTQAPLFLQVPKDDALQPASQTVPRDCMDLLITKGCREFAILPLLCGQQCLGALLLADTSKELRSSSPWLCALCPWIAVYLMTSQITAAIDIKEKIVCASTLHSLAWIVTTELNKWFDWSCQDDTEARLVLLSKDQSSCLVLSKSHNTRQDPLHDLSFNSFSSRNQPPDLGLSGAGAGIEPGTYASLPSNHALSAPLITSRATPAAITGRIGSTTTIKQFDGLVGTQMTIDNTLVRRCISEGSKLLFVADVMSALKKYGEPWKDVFLQLAPVVTPNWIVAAPILSGDQYVAAIMWLSSSKLNVSKLAQAAKVTVPPLLATLGRCINKHMTQNATIPGDALAASVMVPLQPWHVLLSQRSPYNSHNTIDDVEGDAEIDTGKQPMRYMVARTESASTSALMKMYQSAIVQQRQTPAAGANRDMPQPFEEVEIIAKAGQGAFGSVYVAMWRGLVVAVKVMKQHQEGRHTMRTAWELAVTKSLTHANVVSVLAVYTDMAVEKRSKRVIRFIPSTPQDLEAMGGRPVSAVDMAHALDGLPRCQVIIMEYCNLGPLHQYIADHRRARMSAAGQQQQQQQQHHVSDNNAIAQLIRASSCGMQSLHGASAGLPPLGPGMPLAALPMAAGLDTASMAGSVAVTGNVQQQQPGLSPFHNVNTAMPAISGGGMAPSSAPLPGEARLPGTAELPQKQPSADLLTLELPIILSTLMDVAEAMAYLHSNGLVHLDLKPENVLLKASTSDPRGFTAKVGDFGLSELFTNVGPMMGELGGTVTHVAPEIVLYRRVTLACDVYSFGIMMWELVTGQRPYMEFLQSNMEKKQRDKLILSKVAQEGMRPVFSSNTPPEYAALAERCWAHEPMARPTFETLLIELRSMSAQYGTRNSSNECLQLPAMHGYTVAAAALHQAHHQQQLIAASSGA